MYAKKPNNNHDWIFFGLSQNPKFRIFLVASLNKLPLQIKGPSWNRINLIRELAILNFSRVRCAIAPLDGYLCSISIRSFSHNADHRASFYLIQFFIFNRAQFFFGLFFGLLWLGCLRMFCIPAYDDDAFKQPFLLLLRCLFVFQSRIIMHRFVVWFFGALPGPAPPSEISKVVIIEIQFCFHLTQRRRIYCNERRLWAEHEALLAPEPVKMRSEAIFNVMRHKANYRLSSSWT